MTFLHPAQAALVRRSFNGPSRIRGAAGTGKTLVGLHRAAYLARSRPGTVLVTTLVRTLPDVLGPPARPAGARRGRPRRARRRARAGRARCSPSGGSASRSTSPRRAWPSTRPATRCRPDSPLHRCGRAHRGYWRTEIGKVIKGRGHHGPRRVRVGRAHRAPLPAVRSSSVARSGSSTRATSVGSPRPRIHDADDLILLALDELRRSPARGRVLGGGRGRGAGPVRGDRPDAALAGRRHPGRADPDRRRPAGGLPGRLHAGRGRRVRGRARRGARRQLPQRRADRGPGAARGRGRRVHRPRGRGRDEHPPQAGDPQRPATRWWRGSTRRASGTSAMVGRARTVARDTGDHGGVAVLCSTNGAAVLAADALRAAGEHVVLLTEYDGTQVEPIKVGTIKRAKGLEFSQVLLPDVPAEPDRRDRPPGSRRRPGAVGAAASRAVLGDDPGPRRAVGRNRLTSLGGSPGDLPGCTQPRRRLRALARSRRRTGRVAGRSEPCTCSRVYPWIPPPT